jgi:hypothetical protein
MQLYKKNDIEREKSLIQNAGKETNKKRKVLKTKKERSMSSTPSLRGHHPKSYAMNAYLMKGLSKSNVKSQKRLKL